MSLIIEDIINAVPEVGGGSDPVDPNATKVVELTGTITLQNNTIFRGQVMDLIIVTIPSAFEDDFICEIDFSSGDAATAFTIADTVKWTGDDITNNAFVPLINKRYNVMIFWDGLNINGIVRSVTL